MLMQIYIRDLATIEELQLNLAAGCTMITGETGAGKSIFIEAIELALGGRSSHHVVRAGKDKAEISIGFDITNFPHVIARLQALDIYQDTPECIIRRIITSDGRSRCYINGAPQTLQLVKELGELLFHLHGQHEQQVLLQAETQRDMLDRYGDHLSLAATVKQLAEEWKSLDQQILNLREKTEERISRSDYLRFQLEELQDVHLKPGEWENLESEHQRLSHAEELMQHIERASLQIADDENNNVLTSLLEIRKTLEHIQAIEPKALEWINTLNTALISMEDLLSEFKNYLTHAELDPEKLQQMEETISKIFNLARKHKITPQELMNFKQQLTDELQTFQSSDADLIILENKKTQVLLAYQQAAATLTERRKKAATVLAQTISSTMRSLSLPHSEFAVSFEKETAQIALHGNEKIIFLIKTNPDQVLQPLAKVISGGELSRLSLAAHLALAGKTNIPTLVFDEVDTGLSGATAEKIGKLLRTLGQSYQVFCVTHQPQVAAYGQHHLLVEKYFIEKHTYTRLRLLTQKEKTNEIARMLGGEKITEKTLAHATEVLQEINI